MQFTCVLEADHERRRSKQSAAPREELAGRDARRSNTPTPANPRAKFKRSKKNLSGRAYYLSKAIRIVFPPLGDDSGSLPHEAAPHSNGTSTPVQGKPDVRTERFVEVINPVIEVGMPGNQVKALRKGSFASETWEGLRQEWLKRMKEDNEMEVDEDDRPPQNGHRRREDALKRLASDSFESRTQQFTPSRVEIQPSPHRPSSLLSARFSDNHERSTVDPYEGLDADGVPMREDSVRTQRIGDFDFSERDRPSSPWDGSHLRQRRGVVDADSERILSESLEKLVSPRKEGFRLAGGKET
jgi:hypothetical protein